MVCFYCMDTLANTVGFGFSLLRLMISGSRCICLLVSDFYTIELPLDESLH